MNKEEYRPLPAEQLTNRKNRFENEHCRVEFVTTTPELVNRLLDGNLKNRKITESHMKKLTMDFKNGRYIFNGQPIIRDSDGYLRDGQHRLMAIREAGYPPVDILVVTLKGDQSHIEQAYDRMDCNKTRTYAQRLIHKGIDCAKNVAALRRKITYIKTNFNSFPVVSDAVYDEIGQLYTFEIEKVAPLITKGFTADMGAALCLVGRATGCLDECIAMVNKAKAGEMLHIGTVEHTFMKLFNKTMTINNHKLGKNAFHFAAVANGLIAGLQGNKYAAVDTNSQKACKWILQTALDNEVRLLPKSMKDL